jgi:hypothetical protein
LVTVRHAALFGVALFLGEKVHFVAIVSETSPAPSSYT